MANQNTKFNFLKFTFFVLAISAIGCSNSSKSGDNIEPNSTSNSSIFVSKKRFYRSINNSYFYTFVLKSNSNGTMISTLADATLTNGSITTIASSVHFEALSSDIIQILKRNFEDQVDETGLQSEMAGSFVIDVRVPTLRAGTNELSFTVNLTNGSTYTVTDTIDLTEAAYY
jgi:hypothetical protein